jgi:tRNA(Arg) A34 adenosine deaminase TadA
MKDLEYSRLAVDMAKKSFEEGSFPAGAVIVKDGKIISKNTSAKYPKINFHAESKTIDEAINNLDIQLTGCTLYCSMEPCLMCLSRAYWAGIRRIVYVVKKSNVDYKLCYESDIDQQLLVKNFNENIEIVHVGDLEKEALSIYYKWIENNKT